MTASAEQLIEVKPETVADPAKTPEAASGKVDWNFTFTVMSDSGEEILLPYLSPSYAEVVAVKTLSKQADADLVIDTMRKYMARRIGENTPLFNQVMEVMDFEEFGSYVGWCSNPTRREPGKAR